MEFGNAQPLQLGTSEPSEQPQTVQYNTPLKIESTGLSIGQNVTLTGQQITIQPPLVTDYDPYAIVVGRNLTNHLVSQSENKLNISADEIKQLKFDVINLGNPEQPGQKIVLQTDATNQSDVLQLPGNVVLNTQNNGKTLLSGRIQGQALTIRGPGHTTEVKDLDLLLTSDFTIDDSVIVTSDATIELADGDTNLTSRLTLNGNLTVNAGFKLTLLADAISFAPFAGQTTAVITVEAGATLVLGADSLQYANGISFVCKPGGSVVLRGAPSTQVSDTSGVFQSPDYKAAEFKLSAADLSAWTRLMGLDTTRGLTKVTLGDAQAKTTILSPSVWNDLSGTNILLLGTTVDLAKSGTVSSWVLQHETVIQADTGSLNTHVDLLGLGNLSVTARTGKVVMDAGTRIVSNAAAAVSAASGITLGQVQAGSHISLSSASGSILSASTRVAGQQWDVKAPDLSFFGFGPSNGSADQGRTLVASGTTQLHVDAPSTGLTLKGSLPDGVQVYRLVSNQQIYEQVRLLDSQPQRVIASHSVMANAADLLVRGTQLSTARTQYTADGYSWSKPAVTWASSSVKQFLTELQPQETRSWVLNNLLMGNLTTASTSVIDTSLGLQPGADLLQDLGYVA